MVQLAPKSAAETGACAKHRASHCTLHAGVVGTPCSYTASFTQPRQGAGPAHTPTEPDAVIAQPACQGTISPALLGSTGAARRNQEAELRQAALSACAIFAAGVEQWRLPTR